MSVRKRPGKRWAVRFSYTALDGCKHEYNRGGFASEHKAQQHENEVRAGIEAAQQEYRRCAPVTGLNTFHEWIQRWVESTLRVRRRQSGFATEEGRIRNHLLPQLGGMPLSTIRKSHGEQFKAVLQQKGLRPKTVNHCLGLARQILADAVDEGLIDRNPWERLPLLNQGEFAWDWLRPAEMFRFVDAMKEHYPHWLLEVLLGCRAGLRASEVAGLFVEDCDLATGDIAMRRDVVRGHFQPCKTKHSHRTIKVPADLKAELRRKSRHALLRPPVVVTIEGKEHRGHLLSFNRHGKQHKYLPETIARPITGACKKAGLRRITHRDLRHTYASHLRLQGIPLEDIRDLLGHHSIQMVMRYAHIDGQRFKDAAKALEELG